MYSYGMSWRLFKLVFGRYNDLRWAADERVSASFFTDKPCTISPTPEARKVNIRKCIRYKFKEGILTYAVLPHKVYKYDGIWLGSLMRPHLSGAPDAKSCVVESHCLHHIPQEQKAWDSMLTID